MVATERKKITSETTARLLGDVDIIFGCTDDNAGRLVLSRVASFFLTPVIDCGVLLSSGIDGLLSGIDGRVTVLAPGLACLVCRERIDFQQAHAETLPRDEHQRLLDEGYAPALPGVEPAVVAFTTQVAAMVVGELLERLIHYGPDPVPSEVLLRVHEREVSTNHQSPQNGHYCHPRTGKLGLGITNTLLGADMAGMRVGWLKRLLQPWWLLRVSGRVDACDMVPDAPYSEEQWSWLAIRARRLGPSLIVPAEEDTDSCSIWISQRHPLWRIIRYNPLSIWPSIHEITWGRECHFFVRNGRVTWIPLLRLRPRSRQTSTTSRGTLAQPPPPSTGPSVFHRIQC